MGDGFAIGLVFMFGVLSGALMYLSVELVMYWCTKRRLGYETALSGLVPPSVGFALAGACWAVILLVLAA